MHRLPVVLTAIALAAAACSVADGASEQPPPGPSSTRTPLDDPPDPGPVPADDGFDDDERRAIVARTVRVTGFACGIEVEGSGFAVGDELVATNAHVLIGVEQPLVETVQQAELAATPVAFDTVNDLALLRVPGLGLEPFELGSSEDGAVGTLIGWEDEGRPEPTPYRIDRPVTVRIDEVNGSERVERRSWLVATDIESGDSGAALVDRSGVVVGIAYATTRRDAGVAYAIRASELQNLLDGLDPGAEIELPGC